MECNICYNKITDSLISVNGRLNCSSCDYIYCRNCVQNYLSKQHAKADFNIGCKFCMCRQVL